MMEEQYDQMAKKAAYEVKKAIDAFKGEPPQIQEMATRVIMDRVQKMVYGEKVVVEGVGLVTRVD